MSVIHQWEINNKLFLDQYLKKNSPSWGEIDYAFEGIVNGNMVTQNYNDIVDLSTYDLYINKSRNKIGLIFSSMIIARPLKTVIKTCYHLCFPISIYWEVYNAIKDERNRVLKLRANGCISNEPDYGRIALKAAGNSFVDIFRTPMYGAALTIMAILGTGAYFCRFDYLMDLRKLHGRLELSLHWGNKHRCLVKCFVPMENLMRIAKRNKPIEGITQCSIIAFDKMHLKTIEYNEKTAREEPIIYGLTNWAHSQYSRAPDRKLYFKLLNFCI